MTVRIPGALRAYSDGHATVALDITAPETTVATVLEVLATLYPGVVDRVVDDRGDLRRHVGVFVGADPVRDLGGLAAPVADGGEIAILPAVSGG